MNESLSETELALVAKAILVIDIISRHGPFDPHNSTVSCAALSSKGRIFTGVNITHFTGGPCAEHIALGNANAAGILNKATDGEVLTHIVAVFYKGRGVVNPCGKCRQILLDYHEGIQLIVDDRGTLKSVSIQDLMPYSFNSKA
jgi:cytidine deaminase